MKRKIAADGIEQILNVSNSSPRLIFYTFPPLAGKMSHLISLTYFSPLQSLFWKYEGKKNQLATQRGFQKERKTGREWYKTNDEKQWHRLEIVIL
jgi:hypothetical protein